MAQQIIKYQARDGSEWRTMAEAVARDGLVAAVADAMAPLGVRPQELEDGKGYVQHAEATIVGVRWALYKMAAAGPLKWWTDRQKSEHGKTDDDLALRVHVSWHLRMLDGGCAPMERAYGRLACIDDKHREWQQPYYTQNEGGGKKYVQLN